MNNQTYSPWVISEQIYKLMKMFSPKSYFYETRIIFFEQFRVEGHDNLLETGRSGVLNKLLKDFKNNIDLLKIRLTNLRSLKESGVPKLSWKQPNATLDPEDSEIEEFLQSEEITYVYPIFEDKEEALDWIRDYAGVSDTYSFTAIARKSPSDDGFYEVVLQKERHIFEKTKKKYFDLMLELEELEKRLDTSKSVSNKRATSGDDANKPTKTGRAAKKFTHQKEE